MQQATRQPHEAVDVVAAGAVGAAAAITLTRSPTIAAAAAAVGAAGAAVNAAMQKGADPVGSCKGWGKDRMEDARAACGAIKPAMARRMKRMRAWRHSLTAAEAREWQADGAAGPDLRDFEGKHRAYDWRLEYDLVRRQRDGPTLDPVEMIWLRGANGIWVLAEAILGADGLDHLGLGIPSELAHQLGYCNVGGEPHSRFKQHADIRLRLMVAGEEVPFRTVQLPAIKPIRFSIARYEWGMGSYIIPSSLPDAWIPGSARVVVVPAQAIDRQQQGISLTAC